MSLLQALLINLGSIVVPGLILYALLARVAINREKHLGWPMFGAFVLTILLLCLLEVLAFNVFPPLPAFVDMALNFGAYLSLAFIVFKALDLLVIESVLIDK